MSTTSAEIAPASDPLAGLRVLFTSQSYGTVDPLIQKHIRAAIMHSASIGVRWAGDASPDRKPFGYARNSVAHNAVTNAAMVDGVIWCDSDILVEPHTFTRLLRTVRINNLDFVTGVYHQREHPHLPVIYLRSGNKFTNCVDYPPNQISPVSGCGFGICYTSTKMLAAIAALPHFAVDGGGWFPDLRDAGGPGEDLSFCLLAADAGYQLYVDTGVQVGHMGAPAVYTQEDFRKVDVSAVKSISNAWGKPDTD